MYLSDNHKKYLKSKGVRYRIKCVSGCAYPSKENPCPECKVQLEKIGKK